MAPEIPDHAIDSINGLVREGRKIEAIKEVRERLGCDLRDAKDLVEVLEHAIAEQDPTFTPSTAKGKGGCAAAFVLALAVPVALLGTPLGTVFLEFL